MTIKALLMSIGLPGLLLSTSAANSAILFTPPLIPLGNNILECHLVNVSNKSRAAGIQVFNQAGQVVESTETTLGPGEADVVRAVSYAQPRYCRFDVKGKSSDFRASILLRQEGVGAISALPAK